MGHAVRRETPRTGTNAPPIKDTEAGLHVAVAFVPEPSPQSVADADGAMPLLQLVRAMQFGDSMLPVGGFSFSAGLESAVQCGIVRTPDDLQGFTRTALEQAAAGDCVALACAVRVAAQGGDLEELTAMDTAVLTRKPGEENRGMSLRMGKKLLELADQTAQLPQVRGWLAHVRAGNSPGTWPVAQGLVCADLGLTPQAACAVHQYGLAATILNASLRLMRVTHLDTQRILFECARDIPDQCRRAAQASWRHMTAFAPMLDILAAHHVHAHVRLFMN